MATKDLSIWEWEDVKAWMRNNNLGQYIDNLQQHQVNGYDLCYLTNEDLNEMRLTNFHDRNLILKNVRLLTLEQLKIQIKHEDRSVTIQLDFDPNFSIEMLSHSLAEIFKIQGEVLVSTTIENEILMPNLKIVELILLHPQKYKSLKVLSPNESFKSNNYTRDYLKNNYDNNYQNIQPYDTKIPAYKKYTEIENENKIEIKDGDKEHIREVPREKDPIGSLDYKYESRDKDRERNNIPTYNRNTDELSSNVDLSIKSKYLSNYNLDNSSNDPKIITRNIQENFSRDKSNPPNEPYYEKFRYNLYEDKSDASSKTETRPTEKRIPNNSNVNNNYLPSERLRDNNDGNPKQRFSSEKRNFRQPSTEVTEDPRQYDKFSDAQTEKYTSRFNNNYPDIEGKQDNKNSFDIRTKVNNIRTQLTANINSNIDKPNANKNEYKYEGNEFESKKYARNLNNK